MNNIFAIAPTDFEWHKYLRTNEITNNVNFWTPTPWKIKRLSEGDRLYFMMKSPYRKIGGYGVFKEYREESVVSAWNRYGNGNGVRDLQEFVSRMDGYKSKRSIDERSVQETEIGCIVLDNCVFLDENQFIDHKEYGIEFAKQVVKLKYFEDGDPLKDLFEPMDSDTQHKELQFQKEDFKILPPDYEKAKEYRDVTKREGQSEFKKTLMAAYGNKCCVTNVDMKVLLEAAHIQPYMSSDSNHVQNGLLLRVDIHRLFDSGLLWIDQDYKIHVSREVNNFSYRKLDGRSLRLPKVGRFAPSKDAIKDRNQSMK